MNSRLQNTGIPIVIAPGAIAQIDNVVSQLGLTGRGVAVYDDDAFRAVGPKPQVFRSILFDNEQLFVNDLSLHYLRKQCVAEGNYLIAIGGEAVIGITKLVADEAHMPWIAVPTGAFGTGISSRFTQVDTPLGVRRSAGSQPCAVVADTQLMAQASQGVTLGGVRALIDRAEFLARCRAQALAAGYLWDQEAADDQLQAIDAALRLCNTALRKGCPDAYAALCEALILCGLCENALSPAYPKRLNYLDERVLRSVPDAE